MPAVCDPGCVSCSSQNPNQCISCAVGFYLSSSSICMPCSSQCKSCSFSSPNICLSCFSNQFLINGQCTQCNPSSNCLTCSASNTSKCTSCSYGSLITNGVCQIGCPLNCLSCSNTTFCSVCQQGYSANSMGVCLPCLTNCRYCSSQANAICINCGEGFYLNPNGACVACSSPYCLTCTNLGCSVCMQGFYLNSQFSCVRVCSPPCATCAAFNPSACSTCLAGYQFDQTTGTCTPTTTCTNGCTLCPIGYILSLNECLKCQSPNCARCSAQNTNTCSSCNSGYYLNTTSQCSACPAGCATCSSLTNCLSCSTGYTASSQLVTTDQVTCVACVSPCATCIFNQNTCTSCAQGFILQGWKCTPVFNFYFVVVLNQTLSSFYLNYAGFLNTISQSVQASSTNAVTILNMFNGVSAPSGISHLEVGQSNFCTIQGLVNANAPSDSNQAYNNYNQLNSVLQTGTTINGMGVVNSSVTVNGGTIAYPSNANLGLILGICIPVGVISMFFIYFSYCGCYFRCLEEIKGQFFIRLIITKWKRNKIRF